MPCPVDNFQDRRMSLQDLAVNEPAFMPLALADPAFVDWALHIGMRLRNKSPGSSDAAIERIICFDGIPNSEWRDGLVFMLTLSQLNKRKAKTA